MAKFKVLLIDLFKHTIFNMSETAEQAYGAKMTSYQRRCDVISSHRRQHDVILRHLPAGIFA